MNLTGKKILITGGARRIGLATADFLHELGAEVTVHCNTSSCDKYREVKLDFRTGTPEELLDKCGSLDAIVNNASVYLNAPAEEQLRVNCEFPAALTAAFHLRNPRGCAVNVLDSSAASPSSDPYKQSKFLLREATFQQALAFAPGFRVNAVALGPALPPEELAHLKMRRTLETIPLHRAVAARDAAEAIAFLLANESITGAVLNVDCGMGLLA